MHNTIWGCGFSAEPHPLPLDGGGHEVGVNVASIWQALRPDAPHLSLPRGGGRLSSCVSPSIGFTRFCNSLFKAALRVRAAAHMPSWAIMRLGAAAPIAPAGADRESGCPIIARLQSEPFSVCAVSPPPTAGGWGRCKWGHSPATPEMPYRGLISPPPGLPRRGGGVMGHLRKAAAWDAKNRRTLPSPSVFW